MRRYGFNSLWMFSKTRHDIQPADEKALDFMAELGLNFVRIPTDYRYWTSGAGSMGSDMHFLPEGGWNKDSLRDFYQPWRDIAAQGRTIHIGEFGCFNRTPNAVALRWLKDLFDLYREWGWGYALRNFKGAFGIVEHGRPGAKMENYKGYRVDRELLDLFLNGRR